MSGGGLSRSEAENGSRDGASWRRGAARVVAALPMALALAAVTAVWVFGAVWSFTEQSAFATAKHFTDPALLPLVLDGLAISMAGVSFAASLDARPALGARAGTALAVLASATSNGLWAAERTQAPAGPDMTTVALGVGIPIAANIAFEVLLAELRRQVQRRRGLPAPVPLPTLRPIRLLLDPLATFNAWRAEVLTRTAPGALAPSAEGAIDRCELISRGQAPTASDVTAPRGTAFETDPATPAAALPVSATPRGTRHDTEPDQTRPTHPPSGAAEASPYTTPPRVPAGRHVEVAPADAPLEPEPEPLPEAEPLPEPEPEPEPDSESGPESGPEPSSGSRQDTASTDARVVLLGGELAQNPNMTGKDAETALAEAGWDTSYRTARRLLADARRAATTSERDGEPVADHEHARTGTDESVAPGAALSLVPHSPSPTSREGDL